MSETKAAFSGKVQFTKTSDGKVSKLFDVEEFIKDILLMQSQALIAHGATDPSTVIRLFLERQPPAVSQF